MTDPRYTEDCIVWYELTSPSTYSGVWWPCKVLSLGEHSLKIESFFDTCVYNVKESGFAKRVKPFLCDEKDDFVAKGKKKFRKKEGILREFCTAIAQAQDFYREKMDDPSFTLDCDFDPSPNSSLSVSTPQVPHFFGNTTIYTTGGCTTDTSPALSSGQSSSNTKRPRLDILLEPCKESNTRKKPRRSVNTPPGGNNKCLREIVTRLNYDEEESTSLKINGEMAGAQRSHTLENTSLETPEVDILLRDLSPKTEACSTVNLTSSCDPRESASSGEEVNATRLSTRSFVDAANESRGVCTEGSSLNTENSSIDTRPPISSVGSPVDKTSTHSSSSLLFSERSELNPGCNAALLKEMREDSLNSNEGESGSDSDESEMPAVDFSVKEDIRFHDLKENDIVWAKYSTFPFWPAIVTKVKVIRKPKKAKTSLLSRKAKSNIRVKFFGYNDLDQSMLITNHKNVAKFATKRATEFKEMGCKCTDKEQFEQAVEDARELIRLRVSGTVKGTPDQQYKEIQKSRPVTYKSESFGSSPMVLASKTRSSVGEVESATPTDVAVSLGLDSDSEECCISSSEGEEDNEEFQYNLVKVMDIVKKIELDLIAIAKGEVESKRHNLFLRGSEKEKDKLKREGTFGPLIKWKQGKRADFVEYIRKMVLKPQHQPLQCKPNHSYILTVLVPEALTKVMMIAEGLSYEEAHQRL